MKQPTLRPTNKTTAAAVFGALSVILVALLNHFTDMNLGVTESQAITVLLSAVAGWMKTES